MTLDPRPIILWVSVFRISCKTYTSSYTDFGVATIWEGPYLLAFHEWYLQSPRSIFQ